MLEIKDLHASINGKEILKGINLTVKPGEIHAIMGPNGSGKSTLASVLVGNPAFEVTEGEITFNGKDIMELSPEDRSREGMFLSFQYPVEIPGVRRQSIRIHEIAVFYDPRIGIVLQKADSPALDDGKFLLIFKQHADQRRLGHRLFRPR